MTDPLQRSQAFFGERVDEYRQSRSHAAADDLARMVRLLAPGAGMRALDVATGGGHTARALTAAGCRVIATDATPAMVAAAHAAHDADAGLVCDAQRLPFASGALDIVASRIAPHHFPHLLAFVREAARTLRPGGALYVFDLTTPPEAEAARTVDHIERLRDPSHVHSHSAAEWRAALDAAGMRTEHLVETASEFDLEAWIERARMPPERERELRALLEDPPHDLHGYGRTPNGRMRVLRVEIVARK